MFAKYLKAAAAGALLVGAHRRSGDGAEDQAHGLHGARERSARRRSRPTIEKAVPDVEVEWVRDSTGVITARFLAEKDNPRADMVLGLAASSLLLFEKAGPARDLQAQGRRGAEAGVPRRATAQPGPAWTPSSASSASTPSRARRPASTPPKSWKDLTEPKYKDKLVMPHPASSGTGYLTVAAWMQMMGEAEAWKFMDALHQNIAVYTHSGSAPCVQAAKGERVVGIALRHARRLGEDQGRADRGRSRPTEGIGWDMEAFAIVKGTKNLDAAKKVADWAATKAANELYSKYYAVVAHPDVKNVPPNYPADAEKRMVKIDFEMDGGEPRRASSPSGRSATSRRRRRRIRRVPSAPSRMTGRALGAGIAAPVRVGATSACDGHRPGRHDGAAGSGTPTAASGHGDVSRPRGPSICGSATLTKRFGAFTALR